MTKSRSTAVRRLLVLTPGLMGENGVAAVSRSVVKALASDAAIRVETGAFADRAEWDAGKVAAQFWAGGSRLRLVRQSMRSAWSSERADLVLVLHLHLAPLALPYLARGARCAVFLHGIEAWQRLRRREAAVLRHSLLLANSRWTANEFRRANPWLEQVPIRVTHLGIAAQEPLPVPVPGVEGRFALIAGRMHSGERYKGHDLLLDLWPRLLRQIPDARLVVAGEGDDRERLQARAASLRLEPSIRFTGLAADAELAWLYRHCRFFVLPSRGEGFGLVFLEAMRAGKACLGGRGAAGEIIAGGQTGLVVDPTDSEALYHALVRMFLDEAGTAAMGRAGRQRFLDNFTEEQFGRRLRHALDLA